MTSNITSVNPGSLGPAIAPYSQATVCGNLIFVAGQVALDTENSVIAPGDARAQTIAALERTEIILREADASLTDVVSATAYITDRSHFAAFNEGWAAKFGHHRPARATLITGLLIDGLVVEIQSVAVRRGRPS